MKHLSLVLLGLLVLLLGSSFTIPAPRPDGVVMFSLSGTWQGYLTQGAGGFARQYPITMKLTQDEGGTLSGISRIELPGTVPLNFAEMNLTGHINPNARTAKFEEQVIIRQQIEGGVWCIKEGTLRILGGDTLRGPWSGTAVWGPADSNPCPAPGILMLVREPEM